MAQDTEMHGSRRAWWATAILVAGLLAAVLLPLAALGSRFGLWHFSTGFQLLTGATLLACVALVTGIVGIVIAHRRGADAQKWPCWAGAGLGAIVLAVMGIQYTAATSVPAIHNISTDVTDPPQFDRVVALRGPEANPLTYDTAELAPDQRAAYPWVETLHTELSREAALDRSVDVLEDMGLEIVNVDEAAGRVEATATTFWFGFKDDVVVRVRPAPQGSLVDMRSVSRVGRSDLGANADRIGEFLREFQTRG